MPKGQHLVNPELTEFRKEKEVASWLAKLHPETRGSYGDKLFHLCKGLGLTAAEFMERADTDDRKQLRQLQRQVFDYISKQQGGKRSDKTIAYHMAAMNKFLKMKQVPKLDITGLDLKPARAKAKDLIPLDQAVRIIERTGAYKPALMFMLWGADAERFVEFNNDPGVLADVRKQLQDKTRDWIKITVKKRKTNPNPYYILVPRELAAYLPVIARNESISKKFNLWYQWRQAAKKEGIPYNDHEHGAHNLKGTFTTEASKRSLPEVLIQFQTGHIIDTNGYNRVDQDNDWVLSEWRKAFNTPQVATTKELEQRDQQIKAQDQQIKALTKATRELAENELAIAEGQLTMAQELAAMAHGVTPEDDDSEDAVAPKQSTIDHWTKEVDRLRKLLDSLPK